MRESESERERVRERERERERESACVYHIHVAVLTKGAGFQIYVEQLCNLFFTHSALKSQVTYQLSGLPFQLSSEDEGGHHENLLMQKKKELRSQRQSQTLN